MKATHFQIYVDTRGEWRWRLVSRNGKTIADGAEGYSSRTGILRAVGRIRAVNFDTTDVRVIA